MSIAPEANHPAPPALPRDRRSFGCLHFLLIVVIILLSVLIAGLVWVKMNIYASSFEPTKLRPKEQAILDDKLARLDAASEPAKPLQTGNVEGGLEPEAYSEEDADREITITERELNALIAKDPETAKHIAVDLAENLISLKVVVPMDEELPVLGGKTLRLNLGMTLIFESERPVVALRGISLGGIPMPNEWLGNIKNKNLVSEFGDSGGFWDVFSGGVEAMKVQEGELWIKLKE